MNFDFETNESECETLYFILQNW